MQQAKDPGRRDADRRGAGPAVSDFDPAAGVLTIRSGKFGKSRLVPLHPTATAALASYLSDRAALAPGPAGGHLFTSATGSQLKYSHVQRTYRQLTAQAGLTARSAACRPRIHDLRHSFAVASLLSWYRIRRRRPGPAAAGCRPSSATPTPTHLLVLLRFSGYSDARSFLRVRGPGPWLRRSGSYRLSE